MNNSVYLGIDTSNYTTSAAIFSADGIIQEKKLLPVAEGKCGLRQSDKYPSIVATGVRISCEAVEINSVCSPSSSSSRAILRKVMMRLSDTPLTGCMEIATGIRLADLMQIRAT